MINPFARFFKKRSSGLDERQTALLSRYVQNTEGDFYNGSHVSVRSGLHQDNIFISIKRISDAVAMTPLPVYSFDINQRGRDKARQHPVHRILNVKANQDHTAYTYKHIMVAHLLGWGNSFSEIERDARGNVVALNPMYPDDVKIEGRAQDGQLVYSWTNGNQQKFLMKAENVLHIKGVTFDGVVGVSPIMQLRQLVGRSASRDEYQTRFYANGACLGGVITIPDGLTDEQLERHRKSFEQLYKGPANSGKILLLEGTQQYNQLGVNPRDAEFIQSSKLDAGKIAAVFGVPAQMLNEMESTGSRASSEQLFKEWLMLGLNTVFCNIESQINVSLFTPAEQITMYAEFNRESLIQSDFAAMIEGMSKEILNSMLTPNEVREKLNMNPLPGGDSLLAAVNLVPLEMLGQQSQPVNNAIKPKAPTDTPTTPRALEAPANAIAAPTHHRSSKNLMQSYKPLLRDAFQRIGKRERQDIGKAAKKGLRDSGSFDSFITKYYSDGSDFSKYFRGTIQPVLDSISHNVKSKTADRLGTSIDESGDSFTSDYLDDLTTRYTASSRRQLASLLRDLPEGDNAGDAIEERLGEWESGTSDVNPTRAEKDSNNESSRMVNALTRFFLTAGGVTALAWASGGDCCPICDDMDGRTVGTDESFASEGDDLGEGMKAEGSFFNPPLHQGCTCTVEPA